jgi:hypothetical protein
MDELYNSCRARLILGAVLDVVLWLVASRLALWSSMEREVRLIIAVGSLSAATLVFLTPVLWKGTPKQILCALLLAALPCYFLVYVYGVLEKYGAV